jgi:hypothetical protein
MADESRKGYEDMMVEVDGSGVFIPKEFSPAALYDGFGINGSPIKRLDFWRDSKLWWGSLSEIIKMDSTEERLRFLEKRYLTNLVRQNPDFFN